MTRQVLVVGAGMAAMSAALEAAAAGADVLLVAAGGGSSELAQGGIAAAVAPDDSPELHARDTLAAGAGLTDPAAARLLTGEAPATVAWLEASGVAFDRDPSGGPALGLEAAHTRARVLHAGGDASGAALVAALRGRLAGRVTVREARLESLLLGGGVVRGARLSWRGEVSDVRAGAVVLATGGYAGRWPRTTTAELVDGSGLLAALAAGAELADLEMVQFHPTAYAGPGRTFLLTEALRGAGAWLVDASGRRFLRDVDERAELAPRAVVSRAIAERLLATGEPSVFLDARHLGPDLLRARFPGFVARCGAVDLDPAREVVPVAPAAHYTMGGIVTDAAGRTGVPGLLAAGECARTGAHGANRLASNSLLEAVVFGRRAGRAAAAEAAAPGGAVQAAPPPASASRPAEGAALEAAAGPLRSGEALGEQLRRLGPAAGGLAGLVLRAALLRQESRGAHVRTDYPAEEARWAGLEVVARLGQSGRPEVTVRGRGARAAA
ncbi:MAG: FAD-binding protein [Chloroflexi bacterium]|nr:MAG: FAD-binding protein [Chloroflexota bacterium]